MRPPQAPQQAPASSSSASSQIQPLATTPLEPLPAGIFTREIPIEPTAAANNVRNTDLAYDFLRNWRLMRQGRRPYLLLDFSPAAVPLQPLLVATPRGRSLAIPLNFNGETLPAPPVPSIIEMRATRDEFQQALAREAPLAPTRTFAQLPRRHL